MAVLSLKKRTALFSKRPTSKSVTRMESSTATVDHQRAANPNWSSFQNSPKRELIDDWENFSNCYESNTRFFTRHGIWSSEYIEALPAPLHPKTTGKTYNPDDCCNDYDEDDTDEDDDKYYHYLSCCTLDIDLPAVKMDIYALLNDNSIKPKNWGDTVYLNNNNKILVRLLNSPSSLYIISISSSKNDYTAAICYHTVMKSLYVVLKALQLYSSTGISYLVLIDQTCLLSNLHKLKDTRFGFLLTDPNVKRICWNPTFIQEAMDRQVRLSLGSCIDLSQSFNETNLSTLVETIDHYLKDWQDKGQFDDSKKNLRKIIHLYGARPIYQTQ